jgi:hypothetical protein
VHAWDKGTINSNVGHAVMQSFQKPVPPAPRCGERTATKTNKVAVQGCGLVLTGGDDHVAHGMACLPPQAKTASGDAGEDTASRFISYTQPRLLTLPASSSSLRRDCSQKTWRVWQCHHTLILPGLLRSLLPAILCRHWWGNR